MDVYFARMKLLTKSPHVTPRMQFMIQDILELRDCGWVASGLAAPTTISQVHKAAYQRQMSMSRANHPRVGPGEIVIGSSVRTRPKAEDDSPSPQDSPEIFEGSSELDLLR